MRIRGFTAFVIILASCAKILAQDVEFTVSAPNVVAVGEQFRITYKLNARPQEFNPPSFEGFYILAGPSTSTSSSVQIINGQMTQTYEFSYTYIIEATSEGNLTIDPATVLVSKKEYKTVPLTIEVVKGSARHASNLQQQRQASEAEKETEEIFVALEFDRHTAYRGQPILATIKIYTRQSISGFEDVKFPPFNGFWSQDVETPNNIEFQRVNIDGRIYNMGVLKKYLLFPQRTGDILIDPFEVVVISQQRGGRPQSMFDEFFGTFQTVRRRLVSKPVTLKIRDLPPNAPKSFTGAVGSFNLEASFDKTEIFTNEAVNLKVRVAGSGNLRLIETPKMEFPGGFEVFDPKTTDRINTTSQGSSGSKTFEYVAIPRAPGNFDMGKVEFSYFDPVLEKYITLNSKPLALKVEADGSDHTGLQMVGFGREDVRFIGQDIRFIKTDNFNLSTSKTMLFASTKYYIIMLMLILLAILFFQWLHSYRRLMNNIALIKTRKANKMARKRLKLAHQFRLDSNNDKFYDELLRALWGYVSDKLSIPVANLTTDNAKETLAANNVTDVDIEQFINIVSTCEYARFAPKSLSSQMNVLYDNALALITRLEGVIGRYKR